MHLLIFICFFEPFKTISLPGNFTTFQLYEDAIFIAPFNGKSIIKLDSTGSFLSFPITNQENNRIYQFKITPFYFCLNTPLGLVKMHYATGVNEMLYSGNITAFIITNTEEVVLADRIKNEIIFLDTDNKIRLKKKNINVLDMDYFEGMIYLLSSRGILVLDEYGNTIESIKTPENINRISVAEDIYVFAPLSNIVYRWDKEWKRIELKYPVNDLKLNKNYLFTLNQYGDILYLYDRSDF